MSSCPGCGQRVEEGQAVCSGCGRDLGGAQAVGPSAAPNKDYIWKFSARDATMARYDVYVNQGGLTFIKTQSGSTGSGALWTALLGGIIYGRLTRKKYADDLTLKEKLAVAKGSFVMPAGAMVALRLRKVLGQHDLEIDFKSPKRGTESMRLSMSQRDYDAASKLLPTLTQFSNKVRN